jgi:predicted nucleotidyltransferase
MSAGPDLIERHHQAIADLARRFGVSRLEVFGSVCTPEFDPERSDVDFLVTYPPDYDFGPWLARFLDLEAAMSDLLGRQVDVVTSSALRNKWFRREADKTRQVIYDASEVATLA